MSLTLIVSFYIPPVTGLTELTPLLTLLYGSHTIDVVNYYLLDQKTTVTLRWPLKTLYLHCTTLKTKLDDITIIWHPRSYPRSSVKSPRTWLVSLSAHTSCFPDLHESLPDRINLKPPLSRPFFFTLIKTGLVVLIRTTVNRFIPFVSLNHP